MTPLADNPEVASRDSTGETNMARGKARKEKTDHERAEDFKRLAKKKCNSIARQARQLGGMASSRYKYTPAQVDKMQDFLKAELSAAFDALAKGKKTADEGLEL
jgi:hypothetical protein